MTRDRRRDAAGWIRGGVGCVHSCGAISDMMRVVAGCGCGRSLGFSDAFSAWDSWR